MSEIFEASVERAVARSVERFAQGYNCAEAVLMGVNEIFGQPSDSLPRIATGFGAGLSRRGELCGALSGGAMAIGLLQGRGDAGDLAARDRAFESVQAMVAGFQAAHGALRCGDLTGCDLDSEEGRRRAAALDLHGSFCPKFVALAAELAARGVTARA